MSASTATSGDCILRTLYDVVDLMGRPRLEVLQADEHILIGAELLEQVRDGSASGDVTFDAGTRRLVIAATNRVVVYVLDMSVDPGYGGFPAERRQVLLRAASLHDGQRWIEQHPELAGAYIVPATSLMRARGLNAGVIFDTDQVREHPKYAELVAETAVCLF